MKRRLLLHLGSQGLSLDTSVLLVRQRTYAPAGLSSRDVFKRAILS